MKSYLSFSVKPCRFLATDLGAMRILVLVLCALIASTVNAQRSNKPDPELRRYLKAAITEGNSFRDRFDAEVWLVSTNAPLERFIDDPAERESLLRDIHAAASAAKLKPDLVLALIEVESAFDRYAVSSAGAQGLMQVMPFWKNEIGRPDDNLTNVVTNLSYGCYILKFYLEKERGNLTRALARYNGSLGKTWYPERVLVKWKRHWSVAAL